MRAGIVLMGGVEGGYNSVGARPGRFYRRSTSWALGQFCGLSRNEAKSQAPLRDKQPLQHIINQGKIALRKIGEALLRKMKLTNYLFATGTCSAYLVPLSHAANVSTPHDSAVQDATAFAIQVNDKSQTCCILVNTPSVCVSNISMATSCDEHPGCRRQNEHSMAISYTFRPLKSHIKEHIEYFAAFMEAVVPANEKVVFVIHDWGFGLGFDWARKNEERMAGLVCMEFIHMMVTTEDFVGWERNLTKMRDPVTGHQCVIEENYFVEVILREEGTSKGSLPDAVMEHYRRSFAHPADREPQWRIPNEIPP